MSNQKILVPVDFSPQTRDVLEYACVFAKDSNAELLIVHATDPAVQQLEGLETVDAVKGVDAALFAIKPTDSSIPYSHRMLAGSAATTILETAEEENVEMIVMGTHGRSGMKRLLMGSVAEAVVQKAKCPVLTLRQPLTAAKPAKITP